MGGVAFATLAAMIPATAKIAPTERSNPPAMMTSVAAQAMIPTGAHWSRMLIRFVHVRNTSDAIERATKRATKLTTMPKSRNQPSWGLPRPSRARREQLPC